MNLLNNRQDLYQHIESRLDSHQWQTYKFENIKGTPAAVLIPIFFKNNTAHLLFTKRTELVEKHKGQISFPGGMAESGDKDLKQTALRETEEEMGILAEHVTILGRTDNFLTNTRFMVTPFVGFFNYPYDYNINKAEIDEVIEVPLAILLDKNNFKRENWEREGVVWDMHFYSYNGHVIWGVTGFLLSNFINIVFDLDKYSVKSNGIKK